ncbi:MAG TPA: hypothetical protein VHR97_02470 [Candidatus Baltobacteraceae bacterium]|jgi:hypothetical protein|nr:hypothetical protein [Candidatus Baltobacteraceae bacterium]
MKALLSFVTTVAALAALGSLANAQEPPAGAAAQAAPPYVDSDCGVWQDDTWVPNGKCTSTVYKHARVEGTIVSVKGHLVTLQQTSGQVVVDDTIALRDQNSGRVAVGRRVVAHGYWQNNNFYATALTTGPAPPA